MPSDDALLPRNDRIVAALVDQHREFLHFLERRLRDRTIAEDVLQDAFARGLDKVDTIADEESARAWFYRCLRNAVIDQQRRSLTAANALAALARELADPQVASTEIAEVVCQCVTRLVDTLKPEYGDALRRVEVDGLAVKDYAAHAGISVSNAGVRLFRAREALRRQVASACGTCAEHGCVDCSCGRTRPPV